MYVRVHLPLQQGLRLSFSNFSIKRSKVRVHLPLQQGLRRPYSLCGITQNRQVRVHLPLQQGLRPFLKYELF